MQWLLCDGLGKYGLMVQSDERFETVLRVSLWNKEGNLIFDRVVEGTL